MPKAMLLMCKNTAFAQGWARKKPQRMRPSLSIEYLLDFKSLAFFVEYRY